MLQICVFLSVSLFSFFAINYVSSETVQGSVLLNSGVFDKVISCAGAPSCRLDVFYKVEHGDFVQYSYLIYLCVEYAHHFKYRLIYGYYHNVCEMY